MSARVKNPSKDEVGELGRSFNNMADNLAQAQIELKDWGNTLEQKVELRTAEISDINHIIIGRDKEVAKEMIDLAVESEIVLLKCEYSLFRISGLLYQAGIRPVF